MQQPLPQLFPTAELYWLASWSLNGFLTILSSYLQSTEPTSGKYVQTNIKRYIPVYISQIWLFYVILTIPRHDRMMSSIASLAALFYFVKTREQAIEDRFQQETWYMRLLGVIGTFHDIQERKPAEPLIFPRLRQILVECSILACHLFGLWLSREFVLRHDLLAEAIHPIFTLFGDDTVLLLPLSTLSISIACIASCTFAFFSLNVYGDLLTITWIIWGGFRVPDLMDSPHISLSVGEFWTRWDVVIQKLLRKYIYTTLRAQKIPVFWAAFATFSASGFLHVYPIFVSLGGNEWHSALQMMSYFLFQFFSMWIERSYLKIDDWSQQYPWMARFWVLFSLFGPSYVLTMPVLKIVDLHHRFE
jgi:hypothetical protein